MAEDVDNPPVVPPDIAQKDVDDLNVFERLLAFSKQVHVVTIRHYALGAIKVHYAVLEAGEEPKVQKEEVAKIDRDTDPNVFLNVMMGSQERKCWAMIEKAMRVNVCSNSCCSTGPILEKYRISQEQWDTLRKSYPDFTRFASSFILSAMDRDVHDFLPSRKTRALLSA